MKCFALTGGIACGKSTVSKMLTQAKIPVIDADVLARKVVEPGTTGIETIIQKFGKEYIEPNGALNREKMAHKIFSDPKSRLELENIIHPLIGEQLQAELFIYEKKKTPFVIYEAPLIFEKKLDSMFAATILVVLSEKVQIERLLKRDNLDLEKAKKRLSSQMSSEEKQKLTPFIIDNSQDETETLRQLQAIWLKLTNNSL